MRLEKSNHELDLEWLEFELPDASEDEQEDFAERVAIKTQQAFIPEGQARIEAKALLIIGRGETNGKTR